MPGEYSAGYPTFATGLSSTLVSCRMICVYGKCVLHVQQHHALDLRGRSSEDRAKFGGLAPSGRGKR